MATPRAVLAACSFLLIGIPNLGAFGPPTDRSPEPLRFVPVRPCRVVDTHQAPGAFGGPALGAGQVRSFSVPASACRVPSAAKAFALTATVSPEGPILDYLTIWPAGEKQPYVSTLNSWDGRGKTNAAIVPAGAKGRISVFASHPTHVVIDVSGYFVPASDPQGLAFYPVTPCRVADTRRPEGPLGGPALSPTANRAIRISRSACNVPPSAKAFALNVTAVPMKAVGSLAVWGAGTKPSALSASAAKPVPTATAVFSAAGPNGNVNFAASEASHLIVDVNGYFAPPAPGGLSFYTVPPCRMLDTRTDKRPLKPLEVRILKLQSGNCKPRPEARALSVNVTVVPGGVLDYLTLWQGGTRPYVSALNSHDSVVVSNAAVVPVSAATGLSAYATNATELILDLNGYFAP